MEIGKVYDGSNQLQNVHTMILYKDFAASNPIWTTNFDNKNLLPKTITVVDKTPPSPG